MSFRIGQQVRVVRENSKVPVGTIGTVCGYYRFFDRDNDDWEENETEPLIEFDPETLHDDFQDWNNWGHCYHPTGLLYLDNYFLQDASTERTSADIKQVIEGRHNEYKQRMLLRHRSG